MFVFLFRKFKQKLKILWKTLGSKRLSLGGWGKRAVKEKVEPRSSFFGWHSTAARREEHRWPARSLVCQVGQQSPGEHGL